MIKVAQRKVRGQLRWCLDDDSSGTRKRKLFGSEATALAAAANLATRVRDLGREVLEMSVEERASMLSLWLEAREHGHNLRVIYEDWKRAPAPKLEPDGVSAQEVLRQLVVAKRLANRRRAYVNTLDHSLTRFITGRETQPIASFTHEDVEAWLTGRCPWTRRSMISRLRTFFGFAKRHKYLTSDPTEGLEPVYIDQKPPRIMTAEEIDAALRFGVEHPSFLPWLVLGLFAGLRPEEGDAIRKADIFKRSIMIDSAISKVRQRRIVPLEPAARVWLAYAMKRFKHLPLSKAQRRRYQKRLSGVLGWQAWPKDVLRHTAASMLLSKHQDAAKVAMWLGNSPEILFRHYRELVTPAQAKAFWGLKPPRSGVVLGRERGRKATRSGRGSRANRQAFAPA